VATSVRIVAGLDPTDNGLEHFKSVGRLAAVAVWCRWRDPLIFLQSRLESGPTRRAGKMKRTRLTEEQTICVLKEAEAGAKTAHLARG